MAVTGQGPVPARLVAVLASLSMLAPFATDMYLPAFPQLGADLGVGASTVQLTLTAFLVGVGAGQLLFGPLSDQLGRRGPLLAGASVCLLASIGAALAPTASALLAARFVQGFAGAAGIVIARAIVADIRRGREAARLYSLLAMVSGLGPIIAPLFGGVLAVPIGWRGILWTLAGVTAAMLLAAFLQVPETHPRAQRADARAARRASGRRTPDMIVILGRPGFTAHALLMPFAFTALMGYIAASPFVFQSIMGLGVLASGLLFAVNSAGLLLGNATNVRLVTVHGPHTMLRGGIVAMTVASLLLFAVVALPVPGVWLAPPLFVLATSVAFVFGNAVALALGHVPEARGAGSAFIGAAQFFAGASVAPIVGLAGPTSAVPLALVVAGGTAACWVCYVLGSRAGAVPH